MVDSPSPHQFHDCWYAVQKPVVITGVANHWKAAKVWNSPYLRENIGAQRIKVEVYPSGMFEPSLSSREFPMQEMAFRDYIDIIQSPPRSGSWYYAANLSVTQNLPQLFADIEQPSFQPHAPKRTAFWLGPAGTGTRLHYDPYDNILAVIRGRKRFHLFPPCDVNQMYPFPAFSRWGHFSRVDPTHVDRDRFPNWPHHHRIECEIQAGEILFLPHGWWHQVENETQVIALNFFYAVPYLQCFTRPLLRFCAVRFYKKLTKLWPKCDHLPSHTNESRQSTV